MAQCLTNPNIAPSALGKVSPIVLENCLQQLWNIGLTPCSYILAVCEGGTTLWDWLIKFVSPDVLRGLSGTISGTFSDIYSSTLLVLCYFNFPGNSGMMVTVGMTGLFLTCEIRSSIKTFTLGWQPHKWTRKILKLKIRTHLLRGCFLWWFHTVET